MLFVKKSNDVLMFVVLNIQMQSPNDRWVARLFQCTVRMIGCVNYTLMIYEKRLLDEGNQNLQVGCRYKVMGGRLVLANAIMPLFPSLSEWYMPTVIWVYTLNDVFEGCWEYSCRKKIKQIVKNEAERQVAEPLVHRASSDTYDRRGQDYDYDYEYK